MPASAPDSFLIIRPSALGDACRTVPVLTSLRAAWPEARSGWLIQKEFTDAVASHPALDEVVAFPRQELRGAWRSPTRALKSLGFLKSLGKGDWDVVIDCQGLARSGLFARATKAPRRVGFADAGELGWLHFNQRVQTSAKHTVERMMSLVDALGIERKMDMRLYSPPDTEHWWNSYPSRKSGSYAVIAPKSRWPGKEWPEAEWLKLAGELPSLGINQIVLVGSASECAAVDRLAESMGKDGIDVMPMAGRTTVGQLMRIIEESTIVIANDSAPLHIAVGFQRPLVGLFGLTDPAKVGPYGCDRWVVQGKQAPAKGREYRDEKLGQDAMASISVSDVLEFAARALEESR